MPTAVCADPAALVTAGIVNSGGITYPALTFRRRINAADVAYLPESSNGMAPASWETLTTLHGSPAPTGNGMEEVTFRSTVPLSSLTRQFMRLRIATLRTIP